MPLHNTPQSFGSITRMFHWLTALLILTAIPLGVIANNMGYETSEALAQKAQVFSLHKTLGVTAFFLAVFRILWALSQNHPAPLHPERRTETTLAAVIHWLLYISMLAVPLSGWVHHAATSGFAPILWPFGQNLPLVQKSETVAQIAGGLHWVFSKFLIASILLHIAGAAKHHVIDRDATLRRMLSGATAPANPSLMQRHALPLLAAITVYVLVAVMTVALIPSDKTPAATMQIAQSGGNWQVEDGSVSIAVRQLGSNVTGQFATWQADISFDENAPANAMGRINVTIDTTSLSLGSVSDQAKGPDFLNAAANGSALFSAEIQRSGGGYSATGTLSLAGAKVPLTLPFTLAIDGDSALMQGQVTLDRRDFGIGEKYPDEVSVGFSVGVTVTLTATRKTLLETS